MQKVVAKRTLIFWLIVLLHFTIAIYYKQIVGLSINWRPWDELWQVIPTDLIRTDFLRSLWYFHAQPPLFNLFGAFFIKFFYPHYYEAIYFAHILLGSLMAGMIYHVLWTLTHNDWLPLVVALILALNPTIFLYEAYPLYTLLSAFLIVLSLFCLALFQEGKNHKFLYLFILTLNILVLTRTLYHLVILLLAIPFVAYLAGKKWQRMLSVCLLISLSSVAWYGKNLYQFGFFGESSWMGLGLWKIVFIDYTEEELQAFAEQGVIAEPVSELLPFNRPSLYEPYGFTETSPIPVLSGDNHNNINMIAISNMYWQSAIQLIQKEPQHYATNVLKTYLIFTSPPSRFPYVLQNIPKMGLHETAVSQFILGQSYLQTLPTVRGTAVASILTFLLPINLLLYGGWIIQQNGRNKHKWLTYLQRDALMVVIVFFIIYTVVIGTLFEYRENARFQFLVEQPIWIFIIVLNYRLLTKFDMIQKQ